MEDYCEVELHYCAHTKRLYVKKGQKYLQDGEKYIIKVDKQKKLGKLERLIEKKEL